MPRPKRLNEPVKLNLLIDRSSKDNARKLAAQRGISIGRLFESLVAEQSPDDFQTPEVSAQESEAA